MFSKLIKSLTAFCIIMPALLSASTLANTQSTDSENRTVRFELDQAYESEEVIEALENALISQGLLSRGVMHLAFMLHRTGEDTGYESLYRMAESIEFCSAKQTYLMAKADRRNLAVCPFTILAYVTEDEPNKTYLMYQLPTLWGSGDSLNEANIAIADMYENITEEVLFFLE